MKQTLILFASQNSQRTSQLDFFKVLPSLNAESARCVVYLIFVFAMQ